MTPLELTGAVATAVMLAALLVLRWLMTPRDEKPALPVSRPPGKARTGRITSLYGLRERLRDDGDKRGG